jgi:hypothetical protein
MKLKAITVISIGILIYGCSSEYQRQNHLNGMNLYGNVESIRDISFRAIDNNGEITKGKRESNIYGDMDQYILFNDKGNLLEEIRYNPEYGLNRKYTYKYDI